MKHQRSIDPIPILIRVILAGAFAALVLASARPASSSKPGTSPGPVEPMPYSLIAPRGNPLPEPPPTPRNLPLLLPAMEAGKVSPAAIENLLRAHPRELADALRALNHKPGFTHDCLEPPSLDRPPVPDSLDVLHYDIDILEVNHPGEYIRVSTVVTLKALKLLTAIDLDLAKSQALDVRIKLPGRTDFMPAAFTSRDSVLHIGPFTAVAEGQEIRLQIESEGVSSYCRSIKGIQAGAVFTNAPAGVGGPNVDGFHTFSEPGYARYWYPCHDVPWDRATFTIAVTEPEGFRASASGVLLPETAGTGRPTWSIPEPVPTYLAAFYLGDYVTLTDISASGVPLEYFVYPRLVQRARDDFANLPDMVDFFSLLYPYPNPRYAMTLGFFGGGMEHQMNSLISDNSIRGDRSFETLFSHELAHMWWGDLVTTDTWRNIWLNEGFATYCEWIYSEHRYGWQARRDAVALSDSVYINRVVDDPDFPIDDHPILEPPLEDIFSFIVYQKGGRVLDMLRGLSRLRFMGPVPRPPSDWDEAARKGDERFFSLFGEWADAHRFANASTQDFQKVAENALGEDLTWFVDAWLRGLAYARYEYDTVQFGGPQGATVQVELRQVPNGGPVLENVPLQVRYRSRTQILDAVVNLTGERTRWAASLPPGDWTVELDPDDWLLDKTEYVPFFPRVHMAPPTPNPSSGSFTFRGAVGSEPVPPGLLEIFDLSGRLVRSIDMGTIPAGSFQTVWDGRRDDGRPAPSGVYFARIRVGLQAEAQRVVLVR